MYEILVILLVTAVLIPVVVYFSVKLGAYAFVRGRHLAQKELQDPEQEVKSDG